MAGGGEDEVARGRGRRRTGERPGGVVVRGGRGVEAAELGLRRSGMPKCWRKAEVKVHI